MHGAVELGERNPPPKRLDLPRPFTFGTCFAIYANEEITNTRAGGASLLGLDGFTQS